MSECVFLESYEMEKPTMVGSEPVICQRCRLGYEIPLSGCPDACPDFTPLKPGHR